MIDVFLHIYKYRHTHTYSVCTFWHIKSDTGWNCSSPMLGRWLSRYLYVYVYVHVCVCACVCMYKRYNRVSYSLRIYICGASWGTYRHTDP